MFLVSLSASGPSKRFSPHSPDLARVEPEVLSASEMSDALRVEPNLSDCERVKYGEVVSEKDVLARTNTFKRHHPVRVVYRPPDDHVYIHPITTQTGWCWKTLFQHQPPQPPHCQTNRFHLNKEKRCLSPLSRSRTTQAKTRTSSSAPFNSS